MTKKKTDTQQTGNREELLSSGKDYLPKPWSKHYTWLSNVELPKSCKRQDAHYPIFNLFLY